MSLPWRAGVGVMLLGRNGRVFVGQRFDSRAEAWQMPQGGIDAGEEPWPAALRELEEETGIAPELVERLGETADWLSYDLPADIQPVIWGGRYRGQRQKWFAARFLGDDGDIALDRHQPAEFRAWQWVEPAQLPDLIVPFKRELYQRLVAEFAPFLRAASPLPDRGVQQPPESPPPKACHAALDQARQRT